MGVGWGLWTRVQRGFRSAVSSQVNKTPGNRAFWQIMQASAEKIWAAAQEHLRSMLSSETYHLWFAPLRACAQDNNGLELEVADEFCEVWLKDNYMGLLQEVIALASGR